MERKVNAMKKTYLIPEISMEAMSAEDVLTLSYGREGKGSIIDWESNRITG